jgi:predicted DNA-binding transcriptional regulator YafY
VSLKQKNSKAFHKMSEVIQALQIPGAAVQPQGSEPCRVHGLARSVTSHLQRDLAKLRDQLGIPIEYDTRCRRIFTEEDQLRHMSLPGIWLNKSELLALATIQKMLKQLAPTLLGPHLMPLEEKLSELLEKQGLNTPELSRRVKLLDAGKRSIQ